MSKLNRVIIVIEKPFSLDILKHIINNITIFEKLEKMNIDQQEKYIKQKVSEIMTVLQKSNFNKIPIKCQKNKFNT